MTLDINLLDREIDKRGGISRGHHGVINGNVEDDCPVCVIELASVLRGKPWTDDPSVAEFPDLRPINDNITSHTRRTQTMRQLLIIYWGWGWEWTNKQREACAARIMYDISRTIIADSVRNYGKTLIFESYRDKLRDMAQSLVAANTNTTLAHTAQDIVTTLRSSQYLHHENICDLLTAVTHIYCAARALSDAEKHGTNPITELRNTAGYQAMSDCAYAVRSVINAIKRAGTREHREFRETEKQLDDLVDMAASTWYEVAAIIRGLPWGAPPYV